MSWPKRIFDAAMERVETLIRYYGVLHSTRSRVLAQNDASNVANVLGWKDEGIVLMGGGRRRSALLLRKTAVMSPAEFLHDSASDLLRMAHVMSVSALDRYFHDKIIEKCWTLLNGTQTPRQLAEFGVPLSVLRDALKHLRSNKRARPGAQVKTALQTVLQKRTFQSAEDIERAIAMLGGIKDLWRIVADEIGTPQSAKQVRAQLNSVVRRRNQIVHESDFIVMTRPRAPKLREIERQQVRLDVAFVHDFVDACDSLL